MVGRSFLRPLPMKKHGLTWNLHFQLSSKTTTLTGNYVLQDAFHVSQISAFMESFCEICIFAY